MAGVRLGSELLVLVYCFDGTHVQKKKSNNGKVNPVAVNVIKSWLGRHDLSRSLIALQGTSLCCAGGTF